MIIRKCKCFLSTVLKKFGIQNGEIRDKCFKKVLNCDFNGIVKDRNLKFYIIATFKT